jgi:hypothetical protein
MSSTVANNDPTEEAATFNDDAPRECDTTPAIPINLISPKELHEEGVRMIPPWPQTKSKLGRSVRALQFSPCASFLASGAWSSPYLVHIWCISVIDAEGKFA